MPHHHMQHVRNVGPILFACNENIAHIMQRVTARAMTSCAYRVACACRQAGHLIICGMPGFTYGCAVHAGGTIFLKNNRLTF